jgi:branched-chain amino acid transport system ATP-binding protein
MRSIMGLTPPARGRVEWKGRDITGKPPHQIANLGIGFVPEDRRIFAELTVWENLDVGARRRQAGGWTVDRVFELFPKLAELMHRQGGFLSGGEQQMLTIARTLMGNPGLLLLDEPSEGLAPLVVEHMKEQIGRLKRDGLTILLAEQNVGFALELADRVYVLEKGHIRYEGTAREFREDESIRQQYLAL